VDAHLEVHISVAEWTGRLCFEMASIYAAHSLGLRVPDLEFDRNAKSLAYDFFHFQH